MTPLTPEEARHQLVAADALATTSGTDARIGAFTTAAIGVLVGAVLAMSNAFAETNPVAFTIGIVWSTSGSPSWAFFAPYCVLVALPMVVVASRMARR